jgi:hypothetical protein
MYITQGSGGSFSHAGTMANDVRGAEPGVRYAYYSPCDVKLIWRDINNGQGMWQSLEKVRFANGNIDYATFVTCHDNTFDAQIGQVVRQGEQLGNMGDKGNATGVHCHIEIAQHKYDISNWRKNQYGIYCFPNETDTDDCYFVNDTNILEGMGGNWRMIPEESHKIGYKVHIENVGWQDWKFDGETAGTTGESKRIEALRIDYDKDVYAKAHIQDIGWVDYGKIDINTVIGTTGEAKRLECICLKGNFKYRAHIQDSGWSAWTDADGISTIGTVGQALRMEAIEIVEL